MSFLAALWTATWATVVLAQVLALDTRHELEADAETFCTFTCWELQSAEAFSQLTSLAALLHAFRHSSSASVLQRTALPGLVRECDSEKSRELEKGKVLRLQY